jgi:hypothetical protein
MDNDRDYFEAFVNSNPQIHERTWDTIMKVYYQRRYNPAYYDEDGELYVIIPFAIGIDIIIGMPQDMDKFPIALPQTADKLIAILPKILQIGRYYPATYEVDPRFYRGNLPQWENDRAFRKYLFGDSALSKDYRLHPLPAEIRRGNKACRHQLNLQRVILARVHVPLNQYLKIKDRIDNVALLDEKKRASLGKMIQKEIKECGVDILEINLHQGFVPPDMVPRWALIESNDYNLRTLEYHATEHMPDKICRQAVWEISEGPKNNLTVEVLLPTRSGPALKYTWSLGCGCHVCPPPAGYACAFMESVKKRIQQIAEAAGAKSRLAPSSSPISRGRVKKVARNDRIGNLVMFPSGPRKKG